MTIIWQPLNPTVKHKGLVNLHTRIPSTHLLETKCFNLAFSLCPHYLHFLYKPIFIPHIQASGSIAFESTSSVYILSVYILTPLKWNSYLQRNSLKYAIQHISHRVAPQERMSRSSPSNKELQSCNFLKITASFLCI